MIEPLEFRISRVKSFLELVKKGINYQVVPITDDYGPTITEKNIQALVGSSETVQGCEKVNMKRAELGFPSLDIFIVNCIQTQKQGVKLSSSFIRERLSKQ